jgi:hypothetical protein
VVLRAVEPGVAFGGDIRNLHCCALLSPATKRWSRNIDLFTATGLQ